METLKTAKIDIWFVLDGTLSESQLLSLKAKNKYSILVKQKTNSNFELVIY